MNIKMIIQVMIVIGCIISLYFAMQILQSDFPVVGWFF